MTLTKQLKVLLAASALCLSAAAQAVTIDAKQAPTGFFVPTDPQKYDAPYYRWWDQDWGWTHNAIAGPITSAWLMVSAFDVDHPAEVDNIYAYDNGTQTLLGHLEGASDIWNFTFFQLSSDFFDDIEAGLRVWMDIDSTHTSNTWAVTLAKSHLCVNADPNNYRTQCAANPNPAPEPGSMALLGAGLAGLAALRRRKAA